MRISRAVRVGLAFGVAFVIGGVGAAAISGSPGSEFETVFSTAPLKVLNDDSVLVVDPEQLGLGQPILDMIDGSSIYESAQSAGVTAYVVSLDDGSLCVLAVSASDGTAMTCGTAELAAAGRVVLRSQNRPEDPSLFVGIAPNDVTGVEVDGRAGVVFRNAFIASGSPTDDAYTLEGESGLHVTVDMNIDQTLAEEPGSSD